MILDEFELRRMIYDYIKEICHFSQMQVFSTSSYQRNYFQIQIDDAISGLINMILTYSKNTSNINLHNVQQQQEQQIDQHQEPQEEYRQDRQPDQQQNNQQQNNHQQNNQQQNQQQQRLQQEQHQKEEIQNSVQEQQEEPTDTQMVHEVDREITPEELAYYDGADGKPAYVAVNGIVYDVSMIPVWAGGSHFGVLAGKDLSTVFMGCHQGVLERLQRLPIIGALNMNMTESPEQ